MVLDLIEWGLTGNRRRQIPGYPQAGHQAPAASAVGAGRRLASTIERR